MSAKKAKNPVASSTPAAVSGGPAGLSGSDTQERAPSWFDSTDPRKRLVARIVSLGVWVYIAALWLLALDQTFDWGIFGPKTPTP